MAPSEEIPALLKSGRLADALAATKAAIRKDPTDTDLRFMLFQILSLKADWEAASNQLVAYSELTARQSPLPLVYNNLIQAEVRRKYVFLGEEAPTIFGEPPPWISLIVKAVSHAARKEWAAAAELRAQALEEAPGVPGTINGESFGWLMDGDSRLGPVIEAVINSQYYWIPQTRLRSIHLEAPAQARDAVWTAASVTLENDAKISAFIPARYPGAAGWTDDLLKLSRRTDWEEPVSGFYVGQGQRVWMTDNAEFALLDVRELEFSPASA